MDVNLSIHDLSMEDLEYLQNHPYLAEYRDVQSKIQKEINDRKQGLSFCPADHTIFVYHGFHRVENVETTNTVSLRTTEGKPYQLTLDVLNIEGHHFYATYCGNLPKTTYLLGRLLPVEILNSNNDNIWMNRTIQYGIYRPADRKKVRKEYLQNLLAYRIYSKDELNKIFSRDKKYVSSLPKSKISNLIRKLDEIKEAKQAVTETKKVQQQEKLPEVSSIPEATENTQPDTKASTEAFDFAVDENGVFDYSPSKHTIVFGVSKKKIKTYKQYTMRVLSNPHTVISIPVYHDPAKNQFVVTQKDLLSKRTVLIKLYGTSTKEATANMLDYCGYFNNILKPNIASIVRKQFLYDLLQFDLTDRGTLVSCLYKKIKKCRVYSQIVMHDIAYIQTLSNDLLQKFQTHQYYDSILFKLLHKPSVLTEIKKKHCLMEHPSATDKSQLQVSDFYLNELKVMMHSKQRINNIPPIDISIEIRRRTNKEIFSAIEDVVYIIDLNRWRIDYASIQFIETTALTGDLIPIPVKLMFHRKMQKYLISTHLYNQYLNAHRTIMLRFQSLVYLGSLCIKPIDEEELLCNTGYYKLSKLQQQTLIQNLLAFRVLSPDEMVNALYQMHTTKHENIQFVLEKIEDTFVCQSYSKHISQHLSNQKKIQSCSTQFKTVIPIEQNTAPVIDNKTTIRQIPFNPDQLHTVYLYSQKNLLSNRDDYEMVNILVRCANMEAVVPITVYYSKSERKYFLNQESYDLYKRKYGLPYFHLAYYSTTETPFNMKEKSDLRLYGYTVNKIDGLSQKERQELIGQLIDGKLMSQSSIINHLEWLIHSHRDNYRFDDACDKWRDDLKFAYNYTAKTNYDTIFEIQKGV